jgi:hypothetical protein
MVNKTHTHRPCVHRLVGYHALAGSGLPFWVIISLSPSSSAFAGYVVLSVEPTPRGWHPQGYGPDGAEGASGPSLCSGQHRRREWEASGAHAHTGQLHVSGRACCHTHMPRACVCCTDASKGGGADSGVFSHGWMRSQVKNCLELQPGALHELSLAGLGNFCFPVRVTVRLAACRLADGDGEQRPLFWALFVRALPLSWVETGSSLRVGAACCSASRGCCKDAHSISTPLAGTGAWAARGGPTAGAFWVPGHSWRSSHTHH